MKPEIRYVEIREFDKETIGWMFDKNGNRTGFGQTVKMTREELERLYPDIKPDVKYDSD
jgi:hypothetical protein